MQLERQEGNKQRIVLNEHTTDITNNIELNALND